MSRTRIFEGRKFKRISHKIAHVMWLCGANILWEYASVGPEGFFPTSINPQGKSADFDDASYQYFIEVE